MVIFVGYECKPVRLRIYIKTKADLLTPIKTENYSHSSLEMAQSPPLPSAITTFRFLYGSLSSLCVAEWGVSTEYAEC
jgi:hypothetical protein